MTAPDPLSSLQQRLLEMFRDPSGYDLMDLETILRGLGYTREDVHGHGYWLHPTAKSVDVNFTRTLPAAYTHHIARRLLGEHFQIDDP